MNNVEGSVDALRDKFSEEVLIEVDGVVDKDGNIDAGILNIHNRMREFDDKNLDLFHQNMLNNI